MLFVLHANTDHPPGGVHVVDPEFGVSGIAIRRLPDVGACASAAIVRALPPPVVNVPTCAIDGSTALLDGTSATLNDAQKSHAERAQESSGVYQDD